jgi:hypothetical protein
LSEDTDEIATDAPPEFRHVLILPGLWLATIKTFGVIVAGVIAAPELSTDDDN